MRITERDARERGLRTIYLPQTPGRVMPSEISDEIVLVHPAQPWSSKLDEQKTETLQATGVVSTVEGSIPAEDHYFWVHAAHISHNDPVNRRLQFLIREPTTSVQVILHSVEDVAANLTTEMLRSFLIPAGWRLIGTAAGLAAGQVLTLRYTILDFLVGEIAPPL